MPRFCPDCGSPIYTSGTGNPEAVYVKAGTLDDPRLARITVVAWTDSTVDWDQPPANAQSWPQNPE